MIRKPFVRRAVWLAFSLNLAGCMQSPVPPAIAPAAPSGTATGPAAPAALTPVDLAPVPAPVAGGIVGADPVATSAVPAPGAPQPEPVVVPPTATATVSPEFEAIDSLEEPLFEELSLSSRKVSQVGVPGQFLMPGQPGSVPPLSYGADPTLLGQLPPEIPADMADQVLSPLDPSWIAQDIAPDAYQGTAGSYLGFPPGLMNSFWSGRVRVLYVGGVLVPFILVGPRWVPMAFLDRRTRLYIYPTFINAGGGFAPIYHASPTYYEPYHRKHRFGRHAIVERLGFLGKYRPRIGLPRHKVSYLRDHFKKRPPVKIDRHKFRKIKRWR